MATEADKLSLAAVRARHADASRKWSIGSRGEELFAELAPGTKAVAVATLSADCSWQDRDFLLHAHADITFLLRMLADAFAFIRRTTPPRDREPDRMEREARKADGPNYAAECAMKCEERLFRQYLIEQHGLADAADSLRVASHIRKLLDITSRNELNINPEAAARWVDFRSAFEAWRTLG